MLAPVACRATLTCGTIFAGFRLWFKRNKQGRFSLSHTRCAHRVPAPELLAWLEGSICPKRDACKRGESRISTSVFRIGNGQFLRAIADPRHRRHEVLAHRSDGAYDPRRVDIETLKARLRGIAIGKPRAYGEFRTGIIERR